MDASAVVGALPDIKGTAIDHKVDGIKVTRRVHEQSTFTVNYDMQNFLSQLCLA